jgi:hypothetical protein
MVVAQARRTTTYATTTTFTNITLDTTDVENNSAIISHDAVNTDRIYVYDDGLYEIYYHVDGLNAVAGEFSLKVLVNDLTLVPGSESSGKPSSNDKIPTSIVTVVSLTANDYVTLQANHVTSSSSLSNVTLSVRKLKSLYGTSGTAGSSGLSFGTSGSAGSSGLSFGTSGSAGSAGSSGLSFGTSGTAGSSGSSGTIVGFAASGDMVVAQARRTTTYVTTTTFTNITLDTTDVENNSAIISHDAVNTDRIYVYDDGLYEIYYHVDGLNTATGEYSLRVLVDDLTLVPGSESSGKPSSNDKIPTSIVTVVSLTANEYVSLQARHVTAASTLSNVVFSVRKLKSLYGTSGTAGSSGLSFGTSGSAGSAGRTGSSGSSGLSFGTSGSAGSSGLSSPQYWTSGSTWNGSTLFPIRANNPSGLVATGNYAVAEGSGTTASGFASHAQGANTTASGDYSHAEGFQTFALGNYSHAEGYQTTSDNNASHAGGFQSEALGLYSFVHGFDCIATGTSSVAMGQNVRADNTGAIALGRGLSNTFPIRSSGIGSFNAHTRITGTATYGDALANYCAIVGGADHYITTVGTKSGIFAGDINETNADSAGILAGALNTVNGQYSIIAGGASNTISSTAVRSAIIGGTSNVVSAANERCVILGGTSQTTDGSDQIVLGGKRRGGWVYSSTLAAATANTSNTVYVNVVSFTAIAGEVYQAKMIGTYQTAALTTGIKIRIGGTATCNVAGRFVGAITNTAAATELAFPATSMTSEFITTGVAVINTPHHIGADIIFRCTVGGTILMQMASEVNASSAQLNIGTSFIFERIN